MSVPTLLALAGTALMAVAIFVPFRSNGAPDEFVERETDGDDVNGAVDASAHLAPRWPALVEPSAVACDVPARLDLVDALASIRSAWALGVLRHAREDESDPRVCAAIESALDARPSRSSRSDN